MLSVKKGFIGTIKNIQNKYKVWYDSHIDQKTEYFILSFMFGAVGTYGLIIDWCNDATVIGTEIVREISSIWNLFLMLSTVFLMFTILDIKAKHKINVYIVLYYYSFRLKLLDGIIEYRLYKLNLL